MITFRVQEPYKTFLLKGEKTIEGRLNKGKFSNLKIGEYMQLDDSEEIFEIINLTFYSSFSEMLKKEGIKNILPDIEDIQKGIEIYHHFYTPEQEKEFGIIAIQLKKL